MSDNPENKPVTKKQRFVSALLFILLAGAVVFAAYQIRTFILGRQASQPPQWIHSTYSDGNGTAINPSDQPESSLASSPAAAPTELLHEAATHANLKPFSGDPAGISPPDGSQAREGFSQEFAGAISQRRVYDMPGELSQARDFYCNSLNKEGFDLLNEEAAPGSQRLVFIKDRIHVTVSLRSHDEKVKIVRITVTAICPADAR